LFLFCFVCSRLIELTTFSGESTYIVVYPGVKYFRRKRIGDKDEMAVAVFSGRREIHANFQPRLPHHANGALERLPSVACADATRLSI